MTRKESRLLRDYRRCRAALLAASAGIWRNKKDNTCGLACGAAVVLLVEDALETTLPRFEKEARCENPRNP